MLKKKIDIYQKKKLEKLEIQQKTIEIYPKSIDVKQIIDEFSNINENLAIKKIKLLIEFRKFIMTESCINIKINFFISLLGFIVDKYNDSYFNKSFSKIFTEKLINLVYKKNYAEDEYIHGIYDTLDNKYATESTIDVITTFGNCLYNCTNENIIEDFTIFFN